MFRLQRVYVKKAGRNANAQHSETTSHHLISFELLNYSMLHIFLLKDLDV